MVDATHGMHSATNGNGSEFSRLFPNLPPFLISPQAALMLGTAMTVEGRPRSDGSMPAGYTYFGQFIDHDITRDVTGDEDALDGPLPAVMLEIEQARSPTLDLDSVYGSVPTGSNGGVSPRSNGGSGPFFLFGTTLPSPGAGNSGQPLQNDLPRGPKVEETDDQGRPVNKTKVLIPDDRNDENLIVGQMHLAWMKFHNAVARTLMNADMSLSDSMAFEQARDLVTKHYQYIVLNDFLKLVCEPGVWQEVVKNGKCRLCDTTVAENATMPLEFAVAAFRFGHTMIRQAYDWNVNFMQGGAIPGAGPARFQGKSSQISLFFHTRNNLSSDRQLETNWIADWRRLLDFDGTGFDVGGVEFVNAAAFDPLLASGMGNLERAPGKPVLNNLAASNLRRGALRGLPSGQEISKEMSSVKVLTKTELKKNIPTDMAKLFDDLELDQKTPLWFYILQEANARQDGKHLGEMGSILVAETFVSLVKASKPSIIASGWTPAESPLRLANGSEVDTLPKMMVFCEENSVAIVNPLNA